jgi:predicted ATPase
MAATVIRTPDQRLRVFVSSTLGELAPERRAARAAIEQLRLVPVLFELGARPHPPRDLYRAYLAQSHVFVGIYWQRYGWVAPGETISGLEDELRLGRQLPGLFYLREPAPDREPRLEALLASLRDDDRASYRRFTTPDELRDLLEQDLALLLTERFEATARDGSGPAAADRDVASAVSPTLPAPLASLVGREDDRRAVTDLLRGGHRLVTLTGAGGIGKTRLATAIAGGLRDDFPDGVHLVPLGEVEDVALVLPTIASQLGVRLTGDDDAAGALAAALAPWRTLLVLDNLEQVIGVAAALVALLERCPGVQVLATTRQPLGVVGEQQCRLEPLEVAADGSPLAAVATSPAVELFVQRARAVDPTFSLHEGNVADVAELCRRLDGLPLAIELAAARVRLLPPAALLRRLGDRFELLSGGVERPARHRTLRATIDWSVRLLDPGDRTLLARCSVFVGGATLEAIEAVCDLEGRGDVAAGLGRLLDHGLVVVDPDRDGAEPRVRMLETVRGAAADLLRDRGELASMRGRHLDWYAQLADRAQPYLCGPDQVRWFASIDPERANLRAAAHAGLELGQVGTVVELGWDLFVYYHLRGAYREPEAWVAAAAADPSRLDERQRAIARAATGIGALWRGDTTTARHALDDALATFAAAGLPFETAVVELNLAGCAVMEGAWEEAAAVGTAAADRFAAIGHDWGAGSSHHLVGVAASAAGQLERGRARLELAVAAGRRIDNASVAAQALVALAEQSVGTGDHEEARRHLHEAVPLVLDARDVIALAPALEVAAAIAAATGASRTGAVAFAAARATRERMHVGRAPASLSEVHQLTARLVDVEVAGVATGEELPEDPFVVLATVDRELSSSAVP